MTASLQSIIVALLLLSSWPDAHAATVEPVIPVESLQVYVRPGCPHCEKAKQFLAELQARRPVLRVELRDIAADSRALGELESLAAKFHLQPIGVPAFYLRGRLIIGFDSAASTGQDLEALIDGVLPPSAAEPANSRIELPLLGTIDVRRWGLPLFTVVIGLLDGFNPCAMWVLLFLLSMLINLHDRRKMFLIGGVFVAVSGLVYFAFMAAWLNIFLIIGMSRFTQLILGAIALVVGGLNVKDYFALGAGISVGIPERAKPQIYQQVRRIIRAENLIGALTAVILLAFMVNTVELLCTAGLPAVYTRVLTQQGLPDWAYYAYLALYNLAYMADDSLMLAIAVITLGQHKLQERGARGLKLISGLVMLTLGLVLLLRPGWLAKLG